MQTSSLVGSKHPQGQSIEAYLQKQTFVHDEAAPSLCDNTPCS